MDVFGHSIPQASPIHGQLSMAQKTMTTLSSINTCA